MSLYFPPLKPLTKSVKVSNNDRLHWLRVRFLKLPVERQKQLFHLLKPDLKEFIGAKKYENK